MVSYRVILNGRLFLYNPSTGEFAPLLIAGGVDDLVLNAGAGGSTLATDEVGVRHFQRVKLTDGAADSAVAVPAPVTAPASGDAGLVTRTIERRLGATLSTTPLGISGIFTQAGQDGNADGVKYVQAVARADVASASSGFVIEEYDLADDFVDTNFIRTVASATVSANTTTRIHGVVRARKWRVKYTNGATAQATFTLAAVADDIPAYAVESNGDLRIRLTDGTDLALVTAAGELNVLASAQPGVDIGDVTVNNAAGASAVNVQDGGNVLSVDDAAGSLTVDAPVATPVAVRISDGAAFIDPRDVSDRAARLVGQVEGRAADGIAVAGNPVRVAGKDAGGLTQDIATDAAGELQVDVLTLPALVAGTANIGDVDIASPLGAGLEATAVRVTIATDSTGLVSVDDNAGSLTVDAPVATPVAVRQSDGAAFIDPRLIQGEVAHDAVDSGNPLKIGGQANTDEPTAVAIGDRVNAWFDTFGRQVILIGHGDPEPPVIVSGSAAGVSVIAAPGAGVSLHICKGQVNNDAATENIISLREGAAGTIRWTHNCAADGGGSRFDFGSRGWKLPANTALVADIGAATGRVNVEEYYIAA